MIEVDDERNYAEHDGERNLHNRAEATSEGSKKVVITFQSI